MLQCVMDQSPFLANATSTFLEHRMRKLTTYFMTTLEKLAEVGSTLGVFFCRKSIETTSHHNQTLLCNSMKSLYSTCANFSRFEALHLETNDLSMDNFGHVGRFFFQFSSVFRKENCQQTLEPQGEKSRFETQISTETF